MSMFDEIEISRTYLKDLLTKEQEKILKEHDNIYQTKDLDFGLPSQTKKLFKIS